MATRRERVVLDLEDNLTSGLARAAVAAGLLKKELNSLSGTAVSSSRDLDRQAKSTESVGQSTRKANPDIDKFSGRLRTLADAAAILGPAIIPLGAASIPALTASLAGLGAAAGGIGVTVLAMHGLGDAIKAIQDYRLEPTVENLTKLRIEQEKLGPAAAEFATYLVKLGPVIDHLRQASGASLFPGLEDGINALLGRAPQITRIFSELAEGMGNLGRDAGQSLGGDDFTAFFRYLDTDAQPTLEAFGHSAGNVALGVANMLVAFAPLNRDFTGGLEDATKAFADWSAGLDDNESFQEFLSYVRESGPAVVDFLGALVGALTGLIHAAAPFGQVVLPALTGIAKAFAVIADSPIGPPLYAAAAAMIVFQRATALAEKTSTKYAKTWETFGKGGLAARGAGGVGLLALSMTDLDDKIGLSNTSMDAMAGLMVGGPWGAAVGTGIGLVQDLAAANDGLEAAIQAANEAMNSGDLEQMNDALASLRSEIEKTDDAASVSGIGDLFKLLPGAIPLAAGGIDKFGAAWSRFSGSESDAKDKAEDLADAIGHTTRDVGLFSTGVLDAADSVTNLSRALEGLQGWLDKRAALRDYRDTLKELTKGLKDGFGRKDVENIDAVGSSLIKVANSIKDPGTRQNFLTGAVASLNGLAENASPKAQREIQKLIDKMTDLGLARAEPEVSVDDKATPTLDDIGVKLRRTDGASAKPKVNVDPGNSLSLLDRISRLLAGLRDRTITVTTNQRGGVTSSAGGRSTPAPSAGGGTVPKSGMPYADRYHYLLADGEEVISNRNGQADRHRSLLKSINAGRLAGGGTAGQSLVALGGGQGHNVNDGFTLFVAGIWSAANYLKALNKALSEQQKLYDKAKSQRDAAISNRDSISASIQSGLMGGSLFSASQGSSWAAGAHGANDPQAAIAAANARKDRANRLIAAINTLRGKGVTGAPLLEILNEGLEAAEAMAAADLGTLSQFATAVNESNSALAAAGLAGGNAIEGDNIRGLNHRVDRLHDDLKDIHQAINQANADNKKAQDKNAKDVKDGVNGGASNGHKRGK